MKLLTRLLIAALLFVAAPSWSAITLFGTASSPADNTAQSDTADISITPPASMVAGDLIYVYAAHRANVTLTIATTGGQTWTSNTNNASATSSSRSFYAVFNGTWAANPTIHSTTSQGSAFSAHMIVFRPSTGATIAIDQAEQTSAVVAPSSPFDFTRAGQTPTAASSVTIATFHQQAANTWTLQTGGWTNAGGAQFRNTQGASISNSIAYLIQTSITATGSVVNRESAASAGRSHIITFTESVPAPTFSVAPNITSCTSAACSIGFTATQAGTVYCETLSKGTAAPSASAVVSGTGAISTVSKSVSTSADSVTLSSLDNPTHDFHCVIQASAVNSAVSSIADRFKLPTSGTLYDDLTSVATSSFCSAAASPTVAAGDVVEIDSSSIPGGYAVTAFGTCQPSLDAGFDTSRQRLCYRIYDDSAAGWMAGTGSPFCSGTRFAYWINNLSPSFAPSSATLVLDTGSAMTSIDLCAHATDPEEDTLTGAITSGTLPTGLSIGGTNNCTLSGTPTVENESGVNVTFSATDIAGASADLLLTIYPLDTLTVHNCTNEPLGDCISALQAQWFDAGVISLSYSLTVPAGSVVSQSPDAGTEQEEGTLIDLVVSRGRPGASNRLRLGIGLH